MENVSHDISAAGHRSQLGFVFLGLMALDCVMTALAIGQYPAFLQQRLASNYPLVLAGTEIAYAIALWFVARATKGPLFDARRNAIVFGLAAGALEVVNIAIENVFPAAGGNPFVSVGFMLTVFSIWGVGGAWTVRSGKSVGVGILTAVVSAGICMLIGVTAGLIVELFVAPLRPEVVSTWAEFKRSGWTDTRAFVVANTIESAYTHLLMAPIVAVVFGSVGSVVGRFLPTRVAQAA